MLNNLESTIQSIVARATSNLGWEIARTVRRTLGEQLAGVIGLDGAAGGTKRRPGRPRTAQQAASGRAVVAPGQQATKARATKRRRRSPQQVAADEAKILAYVKAHPGQRSIQIGKQIGIPKQHLSSGLETLRASGKVKMKGNRSAAAYSAG